MKKCMVAIMLSVLVFTGCDSFRRLAGRPTSADIEAKRQEIEVEEAAHQARLDSLRRIQKAMADSLELLDEIKASKIMILSRANVKGLTASELSSRYYVVVGTFSSPDNAGLLAEKAAAAGYAPALIPFRNGFTAVGLDGTDKMASAWATLGKVKGEAFCPVDVWVLVNE